MARGARLAAGGGGGAAGPGRPRGSRPGPERRPRGARAAPGSPGGDAGERGGRPATKLGAGRRRGWWALAALQLHLLRALAQGKRGAAAGREGGAPRAARASLQVGSPSPLSAPGGAGRSGSEAPATWSRCAAPGPAAPQVRPPSPGGARRLAEQNFGCPRPRPRPRAAPTRRCAPGDRAGLGRCCPSAGAK